MIRLTIDDKTIEVPQGTTVLQAARLAGADIPTLCDHPSLKPYGGCRLCVVEVEGMRTLQASCTLPANNGMIIHTDTPKTRKSREFVLTLLFSERNHFCMYCQKSGGDCELQNAAYGENMTHWPLVPNWKPYLVDASHPYYVLDNNRCILCRRCVRACGDLVGNFTLGMENRGANTVLVADYGVPLGESSCIKCGTCVQSCPTGALIDRNSAYLGLEKNLVETASVCIGCSVGCGIQAVTRNNQLVRIDGNWDASINGGVLCEQGRYLALEESQQKRILQPLVRKDGQLQPASWEEALASVSTHLKDGAAALASTRLPAEDLFAFKELFAGLPGCSMTGIEEGQTSSDLPGEGSLEALKNADCVVVLGADLVKGHQVAGFFVKRNLSKGTCLIVIDPFENQMENLANYAIHPAKGSDSALLKGILAGMISLGLEKTASGLDLGNFTLSEASQASNVPAETIVALSREIATAQKPVFVFGKGLGKSPEALKVLEALVRAVKAEALINPKGKANSLAGQRYGLNQVFDPKGASAVYLALGDDTPSMHLMERLASVPFLAIQASYVSPLVERADVVLPTTMWAEQAGHYVNLEGTLQEAVKVVEAPEGVRSNLDVLKALAGQLGVAVNGGWKEALG